MEFVDYMEFDCALTGQFIVGSAIRLPDGRFCCVDAAEAVLMTAADSAPTSPIVRLDTLTSRETACPAQFDAMTFCGQSVYIRFRHGFLSVRVGALEYLDIPSPPGDGVLSYADVCAWLRKHGVGR